MPTTLLIKPVTGRRVMDPATRQRLPDEGLQLAIDSPHATYWNRRIADGDVVVSKPTPSNLHKPAVRSKQ